MLACALQLVGPVYAKALAETEEEDWKEPEGVTMKTAADIVVVQAHMLAARFFDGVKYPPHLVKAQQEALKAKESDKVNSP